MGVLARSEFPRPEVPVDLQAKLSRTGQGPCSRKNCWLLSAGFVFADAGPQTPVEAEGLTATFRELTELPREDG